MDTIQAHPRSGIESTLPDVGSIALVSWWSEPIRIAMASVARLVDHVDVLDQTSRRFGRGC